MLKWYGQTWTPFLTQFLADYNEGCHLLVSSIPRLCFLLSKCEKSADYFTALCKNGICTAWCQRCTWHGLGHGTKPAGMILKSRARRSTPKWHSLIYSSNWEHFNCQIISREGTGEAFGWHRPNSCQEVLWLFISTDECVPVPENINCTLRVACTDITMTHK